MTADPLGPNPGKTHFVGDDCEGGHHDPLDPAECLREAHRSICGYWPDCIACMPSDHAAIDRLARAAFEAGQRHIRDTERAVSQGWIGVGGFLSEPKWLPKEEEPR